MLKVKSIRHSRLDESFRFETLYKAFTGKCLYKIDINKLQVNEKGVVYVKTEK